MAATGYVSPTGDTRKVNRTGDTMTGDLVLPDSVPDTGRSAVTKEYVDAAVAEASGGVPANTVAAGTQYGQAPDAGQSASYSRGDHQHGTPEAPTAENLVGLSELLSELLAGFLQLTGGTLTGTLTIEDGQLILHSSGTAINAVDRGALNNFAAYVWRTAGVDQWALQMANDGTNNLVLTDSNGFVVMRVTPGSPPKVTFPAYVTLACGSSAASRTARVKIIDDDLSGLPAAAAWTVVSTSAGSKLQCSIPAVAGDRIEVYPNFLYLGSHFLDWVLLDSGGSIAQYATSESATPPTEGNPALYPTLTISKAPSPEMFEVASGHLNGGMATIALAHQGLGTGSGNRVYAHSTYPWRLRLKNIGGEPS